MKELGKLLKDKRLEQKLHVNKVAQDLRIRHQYLSQIEEGDFSLDNIYMAGYVKNYALYLKVNITDFLEKADVSDVKKKKHYQDDEATDNLQPDPTVPPIMVITVTITAIIISVALLVFLSNFDWLKNKSVPAIESGLQYSDINEPEVNKINSFHIEIPNIKKNNNIIVTANTAVELSVFSEDGSLAARERLEAGQSVTFYGNDYKMLKLITNVANAINISFKN